ncbi:hypothetical protein NDU88_003684 [Pleurodeles waltl]|uniref:Uncharacterized protein n=1 Tax=Pleurodeles waltl TaxID=8319 RepID=A0AAV7T625_PLEWA|nr:hypothetical protein NDU88_003684 [Pleurodeles waltl]
MNHGSRRVPSRFFCSGLGGPRSDTACNAVSYAVIGAWGGSAQEKRVGIHPRSLEDAGRPTSQDRWPALEPETKVRTPGGPSPEAWVRCGPDHAGSVAGGGTAQRGSGKEGSVPRELGAWPVRLN